MGFFERNFHLFFVILTVYSANAGPVNDLSHGLSEFSTEFFLQCAKDKPGNVIVSPLSVANALALLMQGAEGSTLEQLAQGLHLGNEKSTVANQFLEHREALEENAGEAALSIANRIYVQQGQQLNKNFEEVAVTNFKSGIESLNFAEADKSAATINHFVSEQTNGKIIELVKPELFNSDTRSVLVNAIYFKGNWEKKFNKEFTEKGDFYNTDTEKVTVDYMYMESYFNWTHVNELESIAVELRYANSNISFVVVMPTSRTGLAALEAKLKDFRLEKIVENLKPKKWLLQIPKFKVEYDIALTNVLKNLGMTEMFSNGANLSGLLESGQPLQVSDVVHKAIIEIDEEGAVAAAATGIGSMWYSAARIPPSLEINHPFFYFIHERETKTVLFSGHIEKFD